MYIRKEAVLSSMIEGTQSSLADLLRRVDANHVTVEVDGVVVKLILSTIQDNILIY